MGQTGVEITLSILQMFWERYQPVLYAILGFVVLLAIVSGVGRVLSRLRARRIITRSAESKVKLIVLILGISLYISYVVSLIKAETLWFLVALTVIVGGVILYSVRGFLENLFSYLVISTSSVVREGERVVIRLGDEEVEGLVQEMNENYVVLRTEHNALVYIPNSLLSKAIIVRPMLQTLKLRISLRGNNHIDVSNIVRSVQEALRRARLISKTSIQVKPVEVYENRVVVLIEADILNPKNVDEAYTEIMNVLRASLPHKVRIELAE